MNKSFTTTCLSAVLGMALGVSVSFATPILTDPIDPGATYDCTLLTSGKCGNINAACTQSSGTCSVGGSHGHNGWYDYDGDGCGCQI